MPQYQYSDQEMKEELDASEAGNIPLMNDQQWIYIVFAIWTLGIAYWYVDMRHVIVWCNQQSYASVASNLYCFESHYDTDFFQKLAVGLHVRHQGIILHVCCEYKASSILVIAFL